MIRYYTVAVDCIEEDADNALIVEAIFNAVTEGLAYHDITVEPQD